MPGRFAGLKVPPGENRAETKAAALSRKSEILR